MCFGMILTNPTKGTYDVVAYDEAWPRRFRQEQQVISAILGETALSIEHVGPTSIPGNPAQPVIDILIITDGKGIDRDQMRGLMRAGYIDKGDRLENDTRLFSKMGTVNLCLCSDGHPFIEQQRAACLVSQKQ